MALMDGLVVGSREALRHQLESGDNKEVEV